MKDVLNSELFADWLLMSMVGVVLWLLGYVDRQTAYPISVPHWLALITGKSDTQKGQVYLYSFTSQLLGALIFAMVTILTVIGISHEERVFWFRIGVVALLVLMGMFIAFKRLVR